MHVSAEPRLRPVLAAAAPPYPTRRGWLGCEFLRRLYMADVFFNFAADMSEDLTTLGKARCGPHRSAFRFPASGRGVLSQMTVGRIWQVKLIPDGILPKRTEYYANWCQFGLAICEIICSTVRRGHQLASPLQQLSRPSAPVVGRPRIVR